MRRSILTAACVSSVLAGAALSEIALRVERGSHPAMGAPTTAKPPLPGATEADLGSEKNGPAADSYRRISLSLEPARSSSSRAGSTMTFDVSVTNLEDRTLRFNYSARLLTDRGRDVALPQLGNSAALNARANAVRSLTTPAVLQDGYYQLLVTAAAIDQSRTFDGTTAIESVYLKQSSGDLTVVEPEEFFANSKANMGEIRAL